MKHRAAALAAAGLLACGIPGASPVMDPGQDCMACHTGSIAPAWTVAGTVFPAPDSAPDAGLQGAQVIVTDAHGRELTLTSNSAGNFYTTEQLAAPLKVSAQFGSKRLAMSAAPASGSCNTCHAQPPTNDALGRVFVPTQ